MGLVSTTRTNAMVMPINDNDVQLPYASCRTYLTNRISSILCHIMPLVINSLAQARTHTHTQARIPTINTGSILRNQAHAGLLPVRALFNNIA